LPQINYQNFCQQNYQQGKCEIFKNLNTSQKVSTLKNRLKRCRRRHTAVGMTWLMDSLPLRRSRVSARDEAKRRECSDMVGGWIASFLAMTPSGVNKDRQEWERLP